MGINGGGGYENLRQRFKTLSNLKYFFYRQKSWFSTRVLPYR